MAIIVTCLSGTDETRRLRKVTQEHHAQARLLADDLGRLEFALLPQVAADRPAVLAALDAAGLAYVVEERQIFPRE